MGLKPTICQTCGDEGTAYLLIYCVHCEDSAVHHYCLDNFTPEDDNITWKCEECTPKVAKVRLARMSERIVTKKDRAFEERLNLRKRLKKKPNNSSTTKRPSYVKEEPAKTTRLGNLSSSSEETKNLNSFDESCQKKRRVFLDNMDNEEVEFQSIKVETSSFATHDHCGSINISYDQSDMYVHAQPIMEPIWSGTCRITHGSDETIVGLMGHVSSKACSKVSDATTSLPLILDAEIFPKSDVWPSYFQRSSPTDESIALYFFPESERAERVFDSLLDKMIEHNLAMKAMINEEVELLVFSSLELPSQHWRFRRKYYMWSVFKQTKREAKV